MENYVKGLSMSQAFYATVKNFPERTAQIFNPDLYYGDNGGEFTWAEVKERVENIASGLLSLGLKKKERVAIISRNSPYWTHADIATVCCGGVLVTIYPTLSLNEISYIVNDSESQYMFVGSKEILDRILPGLNQMPTVKKMIVMDMQYHSDDPRIISLADLMEMGKKNFKKQHGAYEKIRKGITLDDWATILYTSGTTGQGKGVILSHGAFSSRMDGVYEYFLESGQPVSEKDRSLSFLPLSHVFERGCGQWIPIWVGASIAYADSPGTFMQDLPKYNPSFFSCVPRLYEKIYMQFQEQMSANPRKKKLFDWAMGVGMDVLAYRTDDHGRINMTPEFDVKSKLSVGLRVKYVMADKLFAKIRALFGANFRFAFSASAGIAPDLLRFFFAIGVPIMEGYGLTETTAACCYNPMCAAKPGTIGPEACGSLVRVAEDGELETKKAGLFIGYLNKPEDTAEALTPDGWFKSGDLVQVDQDGYYKVVDRKKAIICLAIGKNVAPYKIEGLYATSTAIDQIFVMGDERTYIAALFVPNFNYFIDLFDKQAIVYDKSKLVYDESSGVKICIEVGEDFVAQPVLQKMIADTVEEVNKALEGFESIKQYEVLPRRFTEERGELTPTLKTKKRVILKNYESVIEAIYQRKKQ
ncbi:MAG: long-chain fatty acid--CoA ligase [Bacillota bacterium]|nr:long-chain fatty acid--CoA ligase [Bacillota bacterium]